MDNLLSQLKGVVSSLEGMRLQPQGSRRRRRRRNNNQQPGPAPQNNPPGNRKRRRRRNNNGAIPSAQMTQAGEDLFRFKKTEVLGSLTIPKATSTKKGGFEIRPAKFPWLAKLSSSFERYRFDQLVVEYVPACAVVTPGIVTIGVDYDWRSDGGDRASVACFTPNASGPVHQRLKLVVPKSRLQSRLWYVDDLADYEDKGPCKLQWAADSGAADKADLVIGEIWVTYSVVFNGTVKSA